MFLKGLLLPNNSAKTATAVDATTPKSDAQQP
jgi:hypothetical protein